MMRRGPTLGRTALAAPMMNPMMMASAQLPLLGMAPSASFAKYVRNKPHLNVGTIGTFTTFNSVFFDALEIDTIDKTRHKATLEMLTRMKIG